MSTHSFEQPLSEQLALVEHMFQKEITGRRFSHGTKPVIRWIKGNGLDDAVTKAAIGQATRLFGASVDYCLCTNDIDAARVRDILEWSTQPVEWWPVTELDNPKLAEVLVQANCPPAHFGYWWKWFPERVRPNAPEWILDGDMVITAKPTWFDLWHAGKDPIRITQDDLCPATGMYGKYVSHVDLDLKLYSGLISLPPKVTYIDQFLDVIQKQPLAIPHDGRKDMCEQGIVAAAFQEFAVLPIPLYEFPFGRPFEGHIDYGVQGDQGQVWGYHFGNSFILDNPHFHRLTKAGIIFSKPKKNWLTRLRYLTKFSGERARNLSERFLWLGNIGQWGIPGWAISDEIAIIICNEAQAFAGKEVLELGTSRGHLSAMLASLGCKLTTIDHQDRGASENLAGLNVKVIVEDAVQFLINTDQLFDLIVVDVHGNTPKDWARLKEPLINRVKPGGKLVIDNVALYEIPEWKEETGVQWFIDQLPESWQVKVNTTVPPGVATIVKGCE
jgi:predicted O-methyltransferase YrrM